MPPVFGVLIRWCFGSVFRKPRQRNGPRDRRIAGSTWVQVIAGIEFRPQVAGMGRIIERLVEIGIAVEDAA